MPPATIVVVTWVRVSTPSSRTNSSPCAPLFATAAANDASGSVGSSSLIAWPDSASTPASRNFAANVSSNTRPSVVVPMSPTTMILRNGGPAKSVSNHAERIVVLWQPERQCRESQQNER